MASCSPLARPQPKPDISTTKRSPPPQPQPLHMMYGGQGNASGFLHELQTSLKSVLLNAPLDTSLHIHYMVDGVAQARLQDILKKDILIQKWRTRQPLHITTYNVQQYVEDWKAVVNETYSAFPPKKDRFRHTIGSYFRLFAHNVLPPDVKEFVYLDSDAVIVANLNHLWKFLQEPTKNNRSYFFRWGERKCAGFLVINAPLLPKFWEQLQTYDLMALGKGGNLGDQRFFKAIQVNDPEHVGMLPGIYDVSVMNGEWRKNKGQILEQHLPQGAAVLHFNGGGTSKASAFLDHPHLKDANRFPGTWGLAHSYAHLPWKWARTQVASQIGPDEAGFKVRVQHH